jgi:hypothetical protein
MVLQFQSKNLFILLKCSCKISFELQLSEWLLLNVKWAIFQLYYGRTSYIRLEEDDNHFVLDQHALLNFCSASSLKQP